MSKKPQTNPELSTASRWIATTALTLAMVIGTVAASLATPSTPGFLTGPTSGDPLQAAADYILDHPGDFGLTAADLDDYEITSEYLSRHSGTTHIALRQRHAGIGVHNAILTINVARDGSLINIGNRFLSDLDSRVIGADAPTFGAAEAVSRVATILGLNLKGPLTTLSESGGMERHTLFGDAGISHVDIPAHLVYQPVGDSVRLAWAVQIQEVRSYDYWNLRIDATTGEELARNNLTIYDSFVAKDKSFTTPTEAPEATCAGSGDGDDDYCVYAMPVESPHHADPNPDGSERTMESDPWLDSATASTLGWNDTDGSPGAELNTTQGNNANAQRSGVHADGGPNRIFNFDIDFTQEPTVGSNVDASISNLYYYNNIIHDLWSDYGFDAAAGNFQENNYSLGGVGGDSVTANAQAPGNCNANMSTPADGGNPTMNMFICDGTTPSRDGSLDNGVIAHEYWHGVSNRLTGGADNVFCLDNSEQAGEGWSDLAGLIMSIEPGDDGADGRGIGTWLLGTGPDGPGIRTQRYSTDLGINDHTYNDISTAAIPHGVGEVWATIYWEVVWALIDEYGYNPNFYGDWTTGGNNLASQLLIDGLKLQPCSPGFVDARDGILDADMALTGGANQCLLWEAFAKRGLGFSADQGSSGSTGDQTEGFDIPSSCDFLGAVPTTVEICQGTDAIYDITLGTAWAGDVTLSTVGEPGGTTSNFSVNPVTTFPGVSQLTIGNTVGLGNSTTNFTVHGVDTTAQTFDLPVGLVSYAAAPGPVTLTAPTNNQTNVAQRPTLEWTAATNGGSYEVQVATDPGFGNIVASESGLQTTSWMAPSALNTATDYYWRVQTVNTCGTTVFGPSFHFVTTTGPGDCDIGVTPNVTASEDFESGAPGWTTSGAGSTWALSGANVHSGSFAYHADDVASVTDQYLVSPTIALPPIDESPVTARFWTAQELEDGGAGCFDGAVAEISTDGGSNWIRLESELLTVPYDGEVDGGYSNPIAGSNAWCGDPRDWAEVVVDVDAWAGQNVNFRIRLATDLSVSHPGMEIDDFRVNSCTAGPIFGDGFETGDTTMWSATSP